MVMSQALKIDIITIFPRMLEGILGESMMKRAREKGLLDVRIHNVRDHAEGKHRITDDTVALEHREQGLRELADRCVHRIAIAPRLAVPEPEVLGPVPTDRAGLDAFLQRLSAVLQQDSRRRTPARQPFARARQ